MLVHENCKTEIFLGCVTETADKDDKLEREVEEEGVQTL